MKSRCALFSVSLAFTIALGWADFMPGAEMYGISQVSNGAVDLVRIDPNSALTTPIGTFSVGPDVVAIENLTYYAPGGQFLTRVLTTGGVSRTLGILDSGTHSLVEVPITGLPVGSQKINGLDYQPSLDRIVITFGPESTSTEDRLGVISLSGNVLLTSANLGLGDRDDVYAHPVLDELVAVDFNGGLPRFAIVTDPFGTPAISTLVNPPADGEFVDVAFEPATGRIFATRRATNDLFEIDVASGSYVPIGAYNTQSSIAGIAFIPEPSSIALAAVALVGLIALGRRRRA